MTFYQYPRVDSFDLYRNYVADVILKCLLPKQKFLSPRLLKGHCLEEGVHKIYNAQNKNYEKASEEYEKQKHIGVTLFNMLPVNKTVEMVQMVYNSMTR